MASMTVPCGRSVGAVVGGGEASVAVVAVASVVVVAVVATDTAAVPIGSVGTLVGWYGCAQC